MSDSVRCHRRQPNRIPRPWESPGKNSGVGCHFLLQCMKVKSVKVKSLSRVRLLATPGIIAYQAPPSMRFSRQKYWSGWPLPSMNRLGVLYISASLTFALHHMTSFWQWIVSRCEASITRSFNCASVVWLGLFSFCACTTKVTALLRKKGADLNPIHSLKQSHFDWPANLSGKKKKKKNIYFLALNPWDLELIAL